MVITPTLNGQTDGRSCRGARLLSRGRSSHGGEMTRYSANRTKVFLDDSRDAVNRAVVRLSEDDWGRILDAEESNSGQRLFRHQITTHTAATTTRAAPART